MPDPRASFSSGLAGVIFGSAPEPELAASEASLVRGVLSRVATATSMQLHREGPWLDAKVLVRLSGRNFLTIARHIEQRAPSAIENMPLLDSKRRALRKSAEMEQIFAPASLDLMIEALQMAGEPDGVV